MERHKRRQAPRENGRFPPRKTRPPNLLPAQSGSLALRSQKGGQPNGRPDGWKGAEIAVNLTTMNFSLGDEDFASVIFNSEHIYQSGVYRGVGLII